MIPQVGTLHPDPLVAQAPTVIISVRVSSDKQIEEGYGHEAQLAMLPRLVEEQGWVLAKRPDGSDAIYDEGAASTTPGDPSSTSLDHRPVMRELLAELDYTCPTYLVCRQLDRIARDQYEHAYIVKRLKAAGALGFAEAPELTSLRPRDITDARDEAMAGIEAIFANLQKADLKIKLMVGRQQRAQGGKPNGGPAPYGYHRPVERAAFEIHAQEAETYRRMVSWATQEHWGPARIAKELTKSGVPTRRGATGWTATTVRRILESKAQCGFVRARFGGGSAPDRWVEAVGQDPIVSLNEWEQMRAIVSSRSRESGHNQRRHTLAGLLRCAACGKTLKAHPDSRRDSDGNKYINYSCRIYNSGCTAGYSISERKALDELGSWVESRLSATDTEGWTAEPGSSEDNSGYEERLAALLDERATARRALERAYRGLIDADEDVSEIAQKEYDRRRQRVRELEDQVAEAEQAYGATRAAPDASPPTLSELREVLRQWRSFPPDDKRAVLSVVIDHAVLGPPDANPRLRVIPA